MVGQIAEIYLNLLLPMFLWALGWFILSVLLKRNDIADIAWGLGFIYLALWVMSITGQGIIQYFITGLVTLWGLRLSIYLSIRNWNKEEDHRYKAWRKEWGRSFFWRSFLQVFLLQTFILMIIGLPIVLASVHTTDSLSWSFIPGFALWGVGFYWQAVGDWQKSRFKANPENKGRIMQQGLWSKSRHPNYFGEICMWWGISLCLWTYTYGWLGLLSPVVITYLLLRVLGVPMLEKKYKGNPEFEAYKKRVPAVFPFLKTG